MTRRYGPIGTAVWESRKFLALENDMHRLGYLYLIACPHGNSLGVFQLKIQYFAADRRITEDQAEGLLADLERVGLIERAAEDHVRVVGWFRQETGANSPSTASSFCKVFNDSRLVRRGNLRSNALGEMVVATLTRAEAWNPDTKPFSQMTRDITNLLVAEMRADPQATLEGFKGQPEPTSGTILHTVLDTVSHTVSHTMLTYEHGNVDVKLKLKRDTETDNGQRTTDNGGQGRKKRIRQAPILPALPGAGSQGAAAKWTNTSRA